MQVKYPQEILQSRIKPFEPMADKIIYIGNADKDSVSVSRINNSYLTKLRKKELSVKKVVISN